MESCCDPPCIISIKEQILQPGRCHRATHAVGHILYVQGSRSKPISYSTSHAETVAAISGLEISSLVSIRLCEILAKIKKPSLQALAAAQERGCDFLPMDVYTDYRDFYELTTGVQNIPQDKSQRVYILCHREACVVGRLRLRWTILILRQSMLADALTKVMVAKQLLGLLTTGEVDFKNEDGHPIEGRRLPGTKEILKKEIRNGSTPSRRSRTSNPSRTSLHHKV